MSIFVIVCFNEHQSGHNAADAFLSMCIIKAVSHAKTKRWCERPPEKDLIAPTDPNQAWLYPTCYNIVSNLD